MIIFHHGYTLFCLFFIVEFYNSLCLGYHLIGYGHNLTRIRRQSGCSITQYRCDNGQCISRHNFCDGQAECLDGSDEYQNCNTEGCPPQTFRCSYGACVDGDSACNGEQNCYDNSDEKNCGTTTNTNCGNQFGCKSGQCIDNYLLCDGEGNCPDGSDETFEQCGSIACQGFSYRCAYGACVDGDVKCDGRNDCFDGSDESPRICGGKPTVVPTPATNVGCSPPIVANADITVSTLGYIQGSIIQHKALVNVQCKANYELSTTYQAITCRDGQWDKAIPRCTDKSSVTQPSTTTCPALVIQNGGYDVLGQGYRQGQPIPDYGILKFKCNAGFTLVPNDDTAYCTSGSFNLPSLPKCIQSCPPKIAPEVEMVCEYNDQTQDCTKPLPEGSTVTMKCKPHYVQPYLVASNVAVCHGGSWDLANIRCEPECGELIPEGSTFIVDGTAAQKGSFPWHVAVYTKKPQDAIYKYICGGSIISVNVVVSAAHCFADEYNGEVHPAENYHIAAGKYYSSYNAPEDSVNVVQKRKVAHLVIPGDYRGLQTSYSGDIAVVVVDKPFVFSQIIKPVCVDWTATYEDEQLKANNHGQVVGWGFTDPSKHIESSTLRQLSAPYIDRGACLDVVPKLFIKYVTLDKYCAGYTNGSSVCNGDSGGGMVFEQKLPRGSKYFLRGVVSAGPTLAQGGCDNSNYGVYTKLSDKIMKFVQSNESKNRGRIQ